MPFWNAKTGQNGLFICGVSIWNSSTGIVKKDLKKFKINILIKDLIKISSDKYFKSILLIFLFLFFFLLIQLVSKWFSTNSLIFKVTLSEEFAKLRALFAFAKYLRSGCTRLRSFVPYVPSSLTRLYHFCTP